MKKKAGHKFLCLDCLYSAKYVVLPEQCIKCAGVVLPVSYKFHFPSPNASRTKWRQFINQCDFLITGYMALPENKSRLLNTIQNKK